MEYKISLLPAVFLTGECLPWPRCSVLTTGKARSTSALVNFVNNPFLPIESLGF
jgi:hypothetical protein